MAWYDYAVGALGGPVGLGAAYLKNNGMPGGGSLNQFLGVGSGDPTNPDRAGLRGNAQQAAQFAGQAQGGYNQLGAQGMSALSALRATANGQNSVSAEQLRQGQQTGMAQQQSMAAAASPQNAAMAARQAAMNNARLGYGISGQQAVAGLQERNQAQQAYGNLLGTLRGQDLQGTLGGYGDVNQAYGAAIGTPQKTDASVILPAISGAASLATMSDRRLKTNVEDGDEDAAKTLAALRAFKFDYKDEKHGKGKQLGVMAQGLEKAGLGHAVIDTPQGKAVHGGKLATSLAAMLPGLHKRISKLEGAK